MEKAVISGDTEALAAYSELEERTAQELASHEECFAARLSEAPSDALIRATRAAREEAREASRRVRQLLAKEKETVAAQLKDARKQAHSSGPPSGSPPPVIIDIEA